jgi:hypothetical protein
MTNRRRIQAAILPTMCEALESRLLLSGSNAIDQLTFGDVTADASSESNHNFEPGYSSSQMPSTGVGALSQTYREPFGLGDSNTDGPQQLVFTMAVDPTRQNYLTIKLWGSDVDGGSIYLAGSPVGQDTPVSVQNFPNGSLVDNQGGPPAFPGRFFYYTVPIQESLTLGKSSTQLTLSFISFYDYYGGTGFNYLAAGQLTRPVYTVYTTTDPDFTPDPNAPTGSAPTQTTTSLGTLTQAQANSLLTSVLNSVYGSNGEYTSVIAEQIPAGTSGAPPEVIGLDLFTNLSTWLKTSHTPDQWREQIAEQLAGRGYTAFPDELLSVLDTTYLTPKISSYAGYPTVGYHNNTLLADMVSAMDGASFSQGSDGGFPTQGGNWVGLVTSPRTSGTYVGLTGRQPTIHGGGSLQGIDTATLGETIIQLLDDPFASPLFQTYLSQTYDADLDGSQMLRAYAYERMLFNHINYLQANTGGTVSQNLFEALALYSSQVALEKLQLLYPNPAWPALLATEGLYYAQMALGLAPTSLLGHNESSDYAMSADGLGEADGTYSGGYDGGYGTYFPELTPYFAELATEDPGATSSSLQTTVSQIVAQSANTINSFDEFISAGSAVTLNANGTIATDKQILSQEGFITYRNSENPNFESFNVNSNYLASDPNGPIKDADALRSAYLEAEFGVTPETGYSNDTLASLQNTRQLAAYENTIQSLVNVNPAALTALPGEPNQPDFAFADVQSGAVAFINDGERFYMNTNYRTTEDQVDYYARIHDTTATIDRAALIMMPHDSTTVQPDGNLTGTNFNSAEVVRYGNYLIVLNRSNVADTISLPMGSGMATDLLTNNTYSMGSSLIVAAGKAVIIDLSSPLTTNLAGISTPAAQCTLPAVQTAASIIAGYPAFTMVNSQQQLFTAAVLNSSNQPINIVPQINWSLQSGSIGTITPDGTYFAPATGIGTATILASYGGVSTSFTVTIVPFTGPGHDVGTVGAVGSDSYSAGVYTLRGAGAGLTGSADAFHFLSQQITGDVSVIAQVGSLSGTSTGATGVMVRDTGTLATTASNSSFADIVYTSSGTLVFQWRTADGSALSSTSVMSPSSTPYVEITRNGNSFSAFYGTNGTTWTQLGTAQTLTLATLAQVGLAVTSGSITLSSTATFQNAQITRPAAEFPTFSVNPAAAWRGGTSNVVDTTSTVKDGSAKLALTYQWWPVSWPANGMVIVGGHGTTSSGVSYEFIEPGTYTFAIKATDAYGLSVIGTATATVGQTLTTLSISDPKQYVAAGSTQQISVQALDEFGLPMTTPAITWSVSGGGSISSSGLFTAPSGSAVSTITATSGSVKGTLFVASAALTNAGTDIGAVALAGSDTYFNATYTVSGSGAGIGASEGAADAFHFVSTSVSGSFSISTELLSQSAVNASAGAGLMVRNGTVANAIYGAVMDSPVSGDGLLFEWRSTVGGPVSWSVVPTPLGATWIKLIDTAGSVAADYSIDGINWIQIGSSQPLSLSSSPLAGLAVTSGNPAGTSTALFSNVVLVSSGPTIVSAASAATTNVTTKSVALNVLGADAAGESTLKYTWSAVGNLTTGVSFSANGSNAAKNTTVTFSAPGSYDLRVVATDTSGLSATSDVLLTVIQTPTSVSITPANVAINVNSTYPFTATVTDQFGVALGVQPPINWSASAGSINAFTGAYTTPSIAQTITLTATSGSAVGTLLVAVKSLGLFTNAQDVGAPAIAGSSSFNGGTNVYTVAGSGSDIWSTTDQFQFIYEKLTGNGTVTARVVSTQNTQSAGHSKAGIMIRNTLDANSAFADAVLTYSDGVEFDYRTTVGGGPNTAGSITTSVPAGGPYWLRLTRTGNTFEVDVAPDVSGSPGTYTVISSTVSITMNATVYIGLAVSAVNVSALNTATFDNVSLTVPTNTFPSNQDIGSPPLAGSYTQNAGVTTLTGSGVDIFTTSDQFQFAYIPITGDVTITARVAMLANTNTNAKAGVMVRNTLAANSAQFSTLVTASNGINLDYRIAAGGSTAETKNSGTGLAAPYWVRVVRSGNSFSSYRSADGVTWTQIGTTQTITMDQTVFVGLAVTSHSTTVLTTATFDNITVMGTVDATPTVATPASATIPTINSVNLSVLGADADGGGESNLIYTWTAVNRPTSGLGSVSFSANGTHSAQNTTAAFTLAGVYLFQVNITDQGNLTASSFVTVTLNQSLTSIAVAPATAISPLGTETFSASAVDQFGQPMASQTSAFTWSLLSGSGSINSSTGLYTAGLTGTSATVQAAIGSTTGSTIISLLNQPPLLANSSTPSASLSLVTGTSTNLSVLAVDDAGTANLSYSWISTGPAAAMFSANNSTAAANTSATFTQAGSYNFTVTITDTGGLSTTASVAVIVNQTFSSVAVTPNALTVAGGTSTPFSAIGLDQFLNPMSAQPTFIWSISGGGTIDSSGNFTASQAGGAYTVTATANSIAGSTLVNVVPTIFSAGGIYDVSLSGGMERIAVGSGPTYSINMSSLPSLIFSGAETDLTVDFTNGDPVPIGGLSFINGDSLTIIGTSGNDTITVDSATISFNADVPITYANIQSIAVDGGSGADVFNQSAQPGGGAALAFTPTSADTLNINGGLYAIPAPSAGSGFNAYPLATLSIADGAAMAVKTAAVPADRTVLVVGDLSIGSVGQLDLGGNDMIVQNDTSGLNTAALIARGLNSGRWTGDGLTSSLAAGSKNRALGMEVNATQDVHGNYTNVPLMNTFDNQPVDATDVLIMYTYFGDADLSGIVDATDYMLIDNGFNGGPAEWRNGDFNYDDAINGDDYSLIDNAFNTQGQNIALVTTSATLISEPSSLPQNFQVIGNATAKRPSTTSDIRFAVAPPSTNSVTDVTTDGASNIQTSSSQVDDLLDAWQSKQQKI